MARMPTAQRGYSTFAACAARVLQLAYEVFKVAKADRFKIGVQRSWSKQMTPSTGESRAQGPSIFDVDRPDMLYMGKC